jgi:hypothetical protein
MFSRHGSVLRKEGFIDMAEKHPAQKPVFDRQAANYPNVDLALKRLQRHIEYGELGPVGPTTWPGGRPRYLVTYMNSQTRGRIRSATVVSVTNQSNLFNRVFVSYFKGLTDNTNPVCVCGFALPPDYTIDFLSRHLPGEITAGNCTCDPELVFDEGRAIVSAMYPEIGVSSRVYYTMGDDDSQLLAITDSKIVAFARGNRGD